MSWEWSHTEGGLENARNNLEQEPIEELQVMWAEIYATREKTRFTGFPEFRRNRYPKCLEYAKKLPADILADSIWEFMEELRTCENGGYRLYACPYGCHTVSVDREGETEETI